MLFIPDNVRFPKRLRERVARKEHPRPGGMSPRGVFIFCGKIALPTFLRVPRGVLKGCYGRYSARIFHDEFASSSAPCCPARASSSPSDSSSTQTFTCSYLSGALLFLEPLGLRSLSLNPCNKKMRRGGKQRLRYKKITSIHKSEHIKRSKYASTQNDGIYPSKYILIESGERRDTLYTQH